MSAVTSPECVVMIRRTNHMKMCFSYFPPLDSFLK